jgi:DNA-binding MarR family transcriptional regulator
MKEAEILRNICEARMGIKPSFWECHVFKTLTYLLETGVAGRPSIIKVLGIGEASMKTLLRRLKESGLVITRRPGGTSLTDSGRTVAEALKQRLQIITSLDPEGLCDDCTAAAVVIKGGEESVRAYGGSVKVRDLIIREGGLGALILFFRGKELMLPTSEGLVRFRGYRLRDEVLERSSLNEGDAVLVGLCRTGISCECVTLNSAIAMLGELGC